MIKSITLLILVITLSSCSIYSRQKVRHSKTTSLVNFLYPSGEIPKDLPNPVLNLPLRVGIAFIPEENSGNHVEPALKIELLNAIKNEFENRKYIQNIQIIPQLYLSNGKNSQQLHQIKQLYQLDVIALVSYNQIVNRKENFFALTYLTIVGSYVFPGSHFNVNTLIDMALIDLNSNRLLFRAAGTHGSKGAAPEAYTKHRYDEHQNNDFSTAMSKLKNNLRTELHVFEQRIRSKNPNDDIQVKAKKGYEMSIDISQVFLLLSLLIIKLQQNSKLRQRKL